jgi:hypothetical protein
MFAQPGEAAERAQDARAASTPSDAFAAHSRSPRQWQATVSQRYRPGQELLADTQTARPEADDKVGSLQEAMESRAAPGMPRSVSPREPTEAAPAGRELAVMITDQHGNGRALPAETRIMLTQALGMELGDVRLHTDLTADRLARTVGAVAFTSGQDIFFKRGAYDRSSRDGLHLLAHEVTHTAQHAAGLVNHSAASAGITVSSPTDGLERAADETADYVVNHMVELQPAIRYDDGRSERPAVVQQAVKPEVLRQETTPAPTPAPTPSRPTPEYFARSDVEKILGRTKSRFVQIASYVDEAPQVIGKVKHQLSVVSSRYQHAYNEYAETIRRAREDARREEEIINTVIAIGVGVLVGVAPEFLGFAEAIDELSLGWRLAAEGVKEGVKEAGAHGIEASGISKVKGTELEPGGLDPRVLDLEISRGLEKAYQGVVKVAGLEPPLFFMHGAAEYALAEIRAQVSGAPAEMTQSNLSDLVAALIQADYGLQTMDTIIPKAIDQLHELQQRVLKAPYYDADRMEQDIWIIWMSDISYEDSGVLDRDAIEDHLLDIHVLGPGDSRLGVDFGWWTTKDDEIKAIRAARKELTNINRKLREVTGAEFP